MCVCLHRWSTYLPSKLFYFASQINKCIGMKFSERKANNANVPKRWATSQRSGGREWEERVGWEEGEVSLSLSTLLRVVDGQIFATNFLACSKVIERWLGWRNSNSEWQTRQERVNRLSAYPVASVSLACKLNVFFRLQLYLVLHTPLVCSFRAHLQTLPSRLGATWPLRGMPRIRQSSAALPRR